MGESHGDPTAFRRLNDLSKEHEQSVFSFRLCA